MCMDVDVYVDVLDKVCMNMNDDVDMYAVVVVYGDACVAADVNVGMHVATGIEDDMCIYIWKCECICR